MVIFLPIFAFLGGEVKFRRLPIPIVDDPVTILTLCRINGNTLRLYTSHWAPMAGV
jgi:hypothetical protein